jgi:hypothetical protein
MNSENRYVATWQFDSHLISRKKLVNLFGEVPSALDEEAFESVISWDGSPLPEDSEKVISSFSKEGKSWSPEIRMWGEESGNRIDLSFDAGRIDSIFVRVDVRNLSIQFLEGVITFSNYIDAVLLVMEDGGVIEPNLQTLVMRIKESNACRFVQDPRKFFENIRKGQIKFRGSK